MKKLLVLAALLSFCTAAVRAEYSRADYIKRVETCEAVLQELQFHPETAVPAAVFRQAKGIVIVHQFKAGLLLGVKGGYGVVLAKKPDGSWSVPGLLHAGEISLGFQIGGQGVDTIYMLMDDTSVKLIFRNRFNFGVDADAVAGPNQKEAEKSTYIIRNSVLVYSTVNGLYAGATIKTNYLTPNDAGNHILYNTTYNLPELLFGNYVTVPDEVKFLMDYVQKLAKQ
ncbi:MAG TPA: lipid-binding SYLF domain-containing protein [Opitutaceae bacterium]|nr:lipid-binding SYLF domain-containing protein [Opitutaceae bacterium]